MKRKPLTRKTPLSRGTSQLRRTQPLTTAPLTPAKRKPLPKKRRTPRRWENRTARRAYVAGVRRCEYHGINGCNNTATDPEHLLGRGRHASDDSRVLLALCNSCHMAIGRGRAATVNGLWVKLCAIVEYQTEPVESYVAFIRTLGFRVGVLSVWLEDGSLRDERVRVRAREVLRWTGE